MINHTNLEDYSDPILYDFEVSDFEPDGPFHLSLAQQVDGPSLELGCGAGRITIPMAKQGIDISGLDIVPGMLAHAQNKAGNLPIQWFEADIRDFRIERQFGMIFAPGCVFEHLLTRGDQEAMLSCVQKHLMTDGLFVIAIRLPQPSLMVNSDGEQFWHSYETEEGQEIRLSGVDVYDPLTQIRHEIAYRRWYDGEGKEITKPAPLALRLIFPQEMEALLHYNHFDIVHRYGDWDSGPLTSESDTIIYVCRGV